MATKAKKENKPAPKKGMSIGDDLPKGNNMIPGTSMMKKGGKIMKGKK